MSGEEKSVPPCQLLVNDFAGATSNSALLDTVTRVCACIVVCGVGWCDCIVVWRSVVRCGVVWCGVVWYGVVWCGVACCGVLWCAMVWCAVVCCSVV